MLVLSRSCGGLAVRRVARAIRRAGELGRVDISDFPLLLHVDDIISGKADVDILWDKFTFRFIE